jgi:hypothetical protein
VQERALLNEAVAAEQQRATEALSAAGMAIAAQEMAEKTYSGCPPRPSHTWACWRCGSEAGPAAQVICGYS